MKLPLLTESLVRGEEPGNCAPGVTALAGDVQGAFSEKSYGDSPISPLEARVAPSDPLSLSLTLQH